MELRGKYTIFAEGCRGHLGKELIAKFNLDNDKDPQHYGIGFKEIWDIQPEDHQEGTVMHTMGWPSHGMHYCTFLMVFGLNVPNFFKSNPIMLWIFVII